MEQEIKIFLVDNSGTYLNVLRAELERHVGLTVVGGTRHGAEALECLQAETPDVLVADLLLPGLDGLSLLRRLKQADRMPPTIVVSAFANEYVARSLSILGVRDFLVKPCELKELVLRIRAAAAGEDAVLCDFDPSIRRALAAAGVAPNLSGRQYLEEAIRQCLLDRSVLLGITKILYPILARRFDTSASCVERSIRSAIAKAWTLTTPDMRHRRFGGVFDSFAAPPGNARFIIAMVEFLETDPDRLEALM